MVSEDEISAAIGGTAYGSDGAKLGTVEAFFADDRTGTPTWVSISTGLFGTRHSIVPVSGARYDDGALHIPVTAEAVKSAPPMAGEHLDPADEEVLRRHYGTTGEAPAASVPAEHVHAEHVPAEHVQAEPVQAGPTEAEPAQADRVAPDAMSRSEEELRVGTERVATTRARLVKYVVTEDVQITVPIRREQIRVERVPIDAADEPGESLVAATAPSGGLPGEIVLHTERPVVTVEVVPVERVRLRVDVVDGQETVTDQVQREQIAVDQHAAPGVTSTSG